MVSLAGFLQNQFLIVNNAFLFALMPAAQVAQDSMKPGISRRLSTKSAPGLDCLHECFLDQILRFGFIAAQQISGTEQTISMGVKELLDIEGIRTFLGGTTRGLGHSQYKCRSRAKGSI